jgi:NAD(P)-dependent dehydrogenase (short-subunit alcohol dehydrogenase family)
VGRAGAARPLGTPIEIARAIAFLLGEQSSFITGAMLLADGGLMHA